MTKYRIIQSTWVGQSGKTYIGYLVQKKGWFFWSMATLTAFDSVEQAELFIELEQCNNKVVKEIVL